MHSAPAVGVVCRDGGIGRAAIAALHGLAIAVMLAWGGAWLDEPGSFRALVPIGLLVVVIAAATLAARRPMGPSMLTWDGQAWQFDGEGVPAGQVAVMLDLGGWMLLRIDTESGHRHWRALSAPAVGPAWRALRCALFARVPAAPQASA